MPKYLLYSIVLLLSFQLQAQQTFTLWKSQVYQHFDNRAELTQDVKKAGKFMARNEASYRKEFLQLDDSLTARELHFERRLLLDTLVSRGKKMRLAPKRLAVYMLRLANACYDTDQGERTILLLNKLLEPKYELNKVSRIQCLMMLGNLELSFQLPEQAIKKYKRVLGELDASTEKKTPAVRSSAYNNMGLAFSQLGNVDSTVRYHEMAFELRREQNNTYLMGQSLNNIGTMYYEVQEYDSALVYYQAGLDYRSASPNATESSLAESWTNIGKTWFQLGNNAKAKELLEKSLVYCKRVSNLEIMKRNYEILHEVYLADGSPREAYAALGNYYLFRDSLYGLNETKEVLRSSYRQEMREQALSDSLNLAANKKIFEEQARKEEIIKYGLGLALGGVFLILLLLFRNYRNKSRSNKQISEQKNALEEKNEEIIGSITYAKRLQDAILPSHETLAKQLPAQFVFYQPKDIVAGDFYWMHTSNNQTFFAVSDCTGHGVPGALVSIVCSNALNRATKEFDLTQTGKILDKTTELVLESFRESKENVNDGMDVSLIRIEDKKLQFSGAYNGLWIVSEHPHRIQEQLQPNQMRLTEANGKSLIEVKANRQPVGYYEDRSPFRSVDLELSSGDTLYMTTDGFGDQFGGSDNKKYKTSQLKRFLLNISDQSILEQQKSVSTEFDQWKGNNEQVDDVCVVGIRLD